MINGEYGANLSWGIFVIPTGTNLKQYYIKGEYTDSYFGTGKVIAPIENNDESKNDRFYVMALEDADDYAKFYDSRDKDFDRIVGSSSDNFGQGRANTEYVNNKWKNEELGLDHYSDLWINIQTEITNGWFVPSKSEWSAFGKVFNITSSTYTLFGLEEHYWTSSIASINMAYRVNFASGYIDSAGCRAASAVRLATTF